tara:strand:- start:1176 stop:2192 length:1017 start_codon:yes stop_codon:yes gene_type:complete
MKILVTGAAGFIGFHTCLELISLGHEIYGVDNINDYYDQQLKFDRLEQLGFNKNGVSTINKEIESKKFKNLRFSRTDIDNDRIINSLFEKENFEVVCHLAAQAGVRFSIENPNAYIKSNISGFLKILEGCRNYKVKHLVYASSSSVYGNNKKIPFETTDNVDHPISLYAATKKSNELMAHTYGHLYGFKTTGLRFFTVYGPWGRPDMAYYLFTDAIYKNKPIKVFNNGIMERDFTYIDDVVHGIARIIEKKIDDRSHYKIYNIGNNKPTKLMEFIDEIENYLGKDAKKIMMGMQAGDVKKTWANVDLLIKNYDYRPNTKTKYGVKKFVNWYLEYNNIN